MGDTSEAAQAAANAAQAAKTSALTAQGEAETARDAARKAQGEAEAARDNAVKAINAAQTAAETAAESGVDRSDEAARFFQRLWIAGTLGAFFTAFARNLPYYFEQRTIFADSGADTDCVYTLLVVLKFGYLFWFLSYFYISNLYNEILGREGRRIRDLLFDVLQSSAALLAAVSLGYVTPDKDLTVDSFFWAGCAIGGICVYTLVSGFVQANPTAKGWNQVAAVRFGGLLLALCSVWLIDVESESSKLWVPATLGVLLFLMFVMLFWYYKLRVFDGDQSR